MQKRMNKYMVGLALPWIGILAACAAGSGGEVAAALERDGVIASTRYTVGFDLATTLTDAATGDVVGEMQWSADERLATWLVHANGLEVTGDMRISGVEPEEANDLALVVYASAADTQASGEVAYDMFRPACGRLVPCPPPQSCTPKTTQTMIGGRWYTFVRYADCSTTMYPSSPPPPPPPSGGGGGGGYGGSSGGGDCATDFDCGPSDYCDGRNCVGLGS